MAILFGGSRINSKTPPATALRVQTALNGQPIAFLHGRNRIAGNLIDYLDFRTLGGGGGKGGALQSGKGGGSTAYTVDPVLGLCEGPIDAVIPTVWASSTIETMAKANFSLNTGTPGQTPFGFLTASYPGHALGYSWLAGVAAAPFKLGHSPTMPNLNFEVTSAIAGAVTELYTVASPYTFTPAYFTLAASAIEQATIPPAAPYQVQAQNWSAQNNLPARKYGGLINGQKLPGSISQGVVDQNGRIFTRITGTPASGQYSITAKGLYSFAAADAGLVVDIVDFIAAPGVHYAYQPTGTLTAGSTSIAGLSSTANLAPGQRILAVGIPAGTVIASVGAAALTLSEAATASGTVTLTVVGAALDQTIGTPDAGQFTLSAQPAAFGQYQFAAADAGATMLIVDVPDANPADSLTDYLTNPRYGCGFPAANLGDLLALESYAYAAGLFISPVWAASQAANAYLKDFSTALNGEFVWSGGLLTFVPYGDTAVTGYGRSYTPSATPVATIDDDDLLKNEGTQSIGVSAFTSDDPVVCVRTRPSDAMNAVRVEYLDRGNGYNPAIAEAKDDAAINAYGLRAADTKQLHLFCDAGAATMSAMLQLGRRQVRNLYSFTVPWYFILLDPMDIIAVSDARLGLDQQLMRIREITENQQDGSLTITAEDYLPGTGWSPAVAQQAQFGFTANFDDTPASVN